MISNIRTPERTLPLYQWASFISMLGSRVQGFAASMELTFGIERWPVSIAVAISFLLNYWPSIVFPLMGGHLGNRFSRRTVVLGAQLLLMAQSLLLWRFHTEVVALYVLGTTASVTAALSQPAESALVQDLAGKQSLHKALATNAAFQSVSSMLAITVSSLVVFQGDKTWFLYVGDAISFLPLIALMSFLKPGHAHGPQDPRHAKATLKDAVVILATDTTARRVLTCYGIMAVCAGGGYVTQRVIALDVFGNLQTYTWFAVANPVGSLIATLIVRKVHEPSISWVLGATQIALLASVAQGASPWLLSSCLAVLTVSFAYTVCDKIARPLVYGGSQHHLESIIGTVDAIIIGTAAVGNLLVGLLTFFIGVQVSLVLLGLVGFLLIQYRGKIPTTPRRWTVAQMRFGVFWWALLTRYKGAQKA